MGGANVKRQQYGGGAKVTVKNSIRSKGQKAKEWESKGTNIVEGQRSKGQPHRGGEGTDQKATVEGEVEGQTIV